MFLKNGPEVKCNNCQEVFNIEPDYFDDLGSQREEGGMGEEIGCFWEYEGQCENCDQHIFISLDAWEYPLGAFSTSNSESEGCKVIKEPEYEVTTGEEDNY